MSSPGIRIDESDRELGKVLRNKTPTAAAEEKILSMFKSIDFKRKREASFFKQNQSILSST
jgi:hypothetical protein